MSDGPYRSLPMRPGWKKVAEQAENKNFDTSQIAESIAQALEKDFSRDIPKRAIDLLKSLFQRVEADLFPEDVISGISQLRTFLEGSAGGALLFDFSERELRNERSPCDGLAAAVSATLEEHLLRAERQIEEFYLRDSRSSKERAPGVRQRIRNAANQVSPEAIARRVLGIESARRAESRKLAGLDDGVPLR